MKKIRYGIVGVGKQGFNYATKIFDQGKIKNGVLTAVCDIDEQRINLIKDKMSDKTIKYYNNYIEMLDSGVCDAVLVEVPHYEHASIVIACLERDINVICDKPAGVYAKQVVEMNKAAEKSKAKYAIMFNQRTNCLYRKMKELVDNGELGQLQRITWIITDWYRPQCYYNDGSWRATWAGEGGGVLINQCPHQLDLIQWVVGQLPKSVNGFCKYGKWRDIEVEDEVTAYLEYENGATGVFITTTGEAPGTNRFEISGSKGKLLCENNKLLFFKNAEDSMEFSLTTDKAFDPPEMEMIELETDGENPQHEGIINNFTNALLGLEEFFVDGKEGLNSVELMNAIEYSGWKGGVKVTLPVNQEDYLEELNKRIKMSKYKA